MKHAINTWIQLPLSPHSLAGLYLTHELKNNVVAQQKTYAGADVNRIKRVYTY